MVEKSYAKGSSEITQWVYCKNELKSSKGKAWSQSIVYSFENKRVEFAEQR